MASSYSWSLIAGSLPTGLTLNPSATRSTTITGTPTVQGSFPFTVRITNTTTGAIHNKVFLLTVNPPEFITGIIDVTPLLTGTFQVTDLHALLTPPFRVVYGINVNSEAELLAQNVPDEKAFLVDASFSGQAGNAFYDAGARPSYLGVRLGAGSFIFRKPTDREIVWYTKITDAGEYQPKNFYRYFAQSTPVWHLYHPWPERGLVGQQWIDILDPDRIYEYYSRLTSHLQYDLQDLNRQLAKMLAPREAPEEWLDLLSEQFGLRLDLSQTYDTQRKRLAELIHVPRRRGTAPVFIIPLRHENVYGYVYEIWADPDDVTNWDAIGGAPAGVVTHMTTIGILDDQVTGNGEKGIDIIVVPHQYFNAVPANGDYWPTGRVAVMLRKLDGTSLGLNLFSYASFKDFADRIAAALDPYLPAHADIRMFVETEAVADTIEELEVDDTLSTTDIDYIIDVTPVLTGTFVVT